MHVVANPIVVVVLSNNLGLNGKKIDSMPITIKSGNINLILRVGLIKSTGNSPIIIYIRIFNIFNIVKKFSLYNTPPNFNVLYSR